MDEIKELSQEIKITIKSCVVNNRPSCMKCIFHNTFLAKKIIEGRCSYLKKKINNYIPKPNCPVWK